MERADDHHAGRESRSRRYDGDENNDELAVVVPRLLASRQMTFYLITRFTASVADSRAVSCQERRSFTSG